MRQFLRSKLAVLSTILMLTTVCAKAQTIVFSQYFASGTVSSTVCNAWETFRSQLLSTYAYDSFRISGSMNPTGIVCHSASIAAAVANALNTASAYSASSDGQTWVVNPGCSAGGSCTSTPVEFGNAGSCSCATSGTTGGSAYDIRPAINNANWGGIGTLTCSASSQTMTVTFYYTPPTVCSGAPTAGTVNPVSPVCASASFNLSLTGTTFASGLTYQWQSSADSVTWTDISGATSVPYTTTESATTYYRCYVTCSASSLADTTPGRKVSFIGACYCVPSFTYTWGCSDYMDVGSSSYPFQLSGALGTSISDPTNCVTAGYIDETSSSYTCSMFTGGSYGTTIGTNMYGYSMSAQAWIDFNSDGTFQTSESIGGASGWSTTTTSPTFTIPSAVSSGVYRMRVMTDYVGGGCGGGGYWCYPNQPPCPTSSGSTMTYYGDVRDYMVTLLPPPVVLADMSSISYGNVSLCATPVVTTSLSGSNLLSSPLTVSAPTGFQVSLDGTTWSSILTISFTPPTLTATTLYVQFAPSSSGTYSGNVVVTGGGLSAGYNIAVAGTAIDASITATPSSIDFGTILTGTFSPVQYITISGSYLCSSSGSFTVTYPSGFYASTGFGTSYSVSYSGGSVSGMTIPVYFYPISVSTYSGNVVISGGGLLSSVNVPVTGNGGMPCSGIPTAGAASITPTNGSASTLFTVTLSGYTLATGLTFQWQSAPTSTGSWSNISGATNLTSTFTGITANTYFRCLVTCPTYGTGISDTIEAILMNCTPTSSSWSELSALTFSYSGSIQSWVVPTGITSIGITASGAQGGNSTAGSYTGGLGAIISGTFSVVPGHVLNIITGQHPADAYYTGGGGGGSFIWDVTAGNTLLIAAGGGGGAGYGSASNNGVDASTGLDGNYGAQGSSYGGNGTGGNGGTGLSSGYWAAGGAGWLSNGDNTNYSFCTYAATGGETPLSGGAGGAWGGYSATNNSPGGFGGGGGSQGYCSWLGGGGGGGYSGGAPGLNTAYGGGGGGSYNGGTSQSNVIGNSGDGIVNIYLSTGVDSTNYGVDAFHVAAGTGADLTDGGIAAAASMTTGYLDHTSMTPVILYAGGVHSASVTWGTATSYQEAQVWIDFDNDGAFAVSEEVSAVVGYSSVATPNPTIFNISIPATAPLGNHLMRVRGILESPTSGYALSSHLDPCLIQYLTTSPVYDNGDVVDYTVTIGTMPGCSGMPTAGLASSLPNSGNSSTSFTLSLSGFTLASGLTFQWQDSVAGGTWTNISGATDYSYNFTGISTNTYFQCLVSCGTNTATSTSVLDTFVLPASSCTPSFVYTWGCSDYMDVGSSSYPFQLSGEAGTSISDPTNCVTSGYIDETATTYTCSMFPGGTYFATIGTNYYGYSMSAQAWIDFNSDGTFQTSESVGGAAGWSTTTTNATFTIPTSALPGVYRMRVMTDYAPGCSTGYWCYPNQPPCPSSSGTTMTYYGDVRDYTVTLLPPPTVVAVPTSLSFGAVSLCNSSGLSFSISGTNMISSPVTIGAPSGYLVSLDSATWTTSLDIAFTVPTLTATTVYVLFTPTSATTFTGNITVTGGGLAAEYDVPVSGTGANASVTPIPSSLAFGTIGVGTFSPVQDITIDGSYLCGTSGTFTVTYPSNFFSSTGFSTTYSLSYTGGGISGATIPVYFYPMAIGAYSGNVTITGGGLVSPILVPVSGFGGTPCTGIPTAGTASISPAFGGTTTAFTLSLTGYTIATGLTFQWQSAPSSTGTFTNITGATTINYGFTGIAANTYYRCIVTCPTYTSSSSDTIMAELMTCMTTGASWASVGSMLYNFTGSVQTFTVPAGITSIDVDMAGAKGGDYPTHGIGGNGGRSQGTLAVTPGTNLYIYVGRHGDSSNGSGFLPIGGSNSGGGANGGNGSTSVGGAAGGGATDIRTLAGGTTTELMSRLMVAAGGSGGAWDCGEDGAAGGGLSGADGTDCGSGYGYGGTQTAGGIGGSGGGTDGGLGYGGDAYSSYYGSGGGGGYFGGGGAYSGSGGGGSSFADGTYVTGYTTTSGYQNGDGYVQISFSSGDITSYGVDALTISASSGSDLVDAGIASAADATSGYLDHISMAPVTLYQGAAAPTTITWGTATSHQEAQVWIDFNNNGTFESSEEVSSVVGYSTTSTTNPTTFNINIPSTAPLGNHLMRVRGIVEEPGTYGLSSHLDPCLSQYASAGPVYNFGDEVDYTVVISSPTCSGTPTAGTVTASVSTGCGTYTSSLSLTGATAGLGIVYQWQASTDNLTWTNVSGATSNTYSATVTSSIYYRCIDSCSSSGMSAATPGKYLAIPVVGAITGSSTVCIGDSIALGDTTTGGTWSSGSTAIATINPISGVVRGLTAGVAAITYTTGLGCVVTTSVTVNSAGTITGPVTVCVGNIETLSDAMSGGTWSSAGSNVSVAPGGAVTGLIPGTATITYTLGACSTTRGITVNPSMAAISGLDSVCQGATITLADAVTGGTWSSSSSTTASVGAGTGIVSGGLVGSAIITYSSSSCYTTKIVNVKMSPSAISGSTTVCSGNVISLSDITTGGVWISDTPSIATITTVGVLSGITGGTTVISYLVGSCAATSFMTVYSIPVAIAGADTICSGATTTLTDAVSGGTWSSSLLSVATISSGGVVTGMGAGTVIITYGNTGCFVTKSIVVNATPGPIGGALSFCIGSTSSLIDGTTGGVWSSGSTTIATVTSGGVVNGLSGGTAVITYALGTCATTKVVTVNVTSPILPAYVSLCSSGGSTTLTDASTGGIWVSGSAGVATIGSSNGIVSSVAIGIDTITYTASCGSVTSIVEIVSTPSPIGGAGSVCVGSTITLTDTLAGGIWSSSNPLLASVDVSSGVVTGVATGVVTITYTSGCGPVYKNITVNPQPAIIVGSASVCQGSSISLSDATTGGTWSSDSSTASVVGGSVTGITAGTATISYTISTGCYQTQSLVINPLPISGTISGADTVCIGASIVLSDTLAGGTWSSSSSSIASVSGDTVTGISSGLVTISYSVINGCGVSNATKSVYVNGVPSAGTIIGTGFVCASSTTTLTDVVTGGSWSTVTGSAYVSGGVVTGIVAGNDTVFYTVSNSCGSASASIAFTVNPPLTPITGAGSVCPTVTETLSNVTTGGTWSASNLNATVGSGTGVVTGAIGGLDTITYTAGGCYITALISVNPSPNAGVIAGPDSVCIGSPIAFTDAITGGTWSLSNSTIASISGSVVTGMVAGYDTLIYSTTNVCGTANANKLVYVVPTPTAGVIVGVDSLCLGTITTLGETVSGGLWSSSASAIATIDGIGIVTAHSAGTFTITYSVLAPCGSPFVTKILTVNPLPATITGTSSMCQGAPAVMLDATTGGIWSSSDSTIVSINSATGIGAALSVGSATIRYILSDGCSQSLNVTVSSIPNAGTISGAGAVCVGDSTVVSDVVSGGVWSTSASIFSVSSSGLVTGISAGVDTVKYTVYNTCGNNIAKKAITVNPLPIPGSISGAGAVCTGNSIVLTESVTGGSWSASNTNATVTGGNVTGVSAGLVTISYSVSNFCGTKSATANVAVNAMPSSISGPSGICVGVPTSYTDSLMSAIWSSSSVSTATVDSHGVVTGIFAGIDTITYNNLGCRVTKLITVNASPFAGVITGSTNICIGAVTTLIDTTIGGTWSVSNANANVVGGFVTGITAGMDSVRYTSHSVACGDSIATLVVNVLPLPNPGAIGGLDSVCNNSYIIVTETSTGGTWSSRNNHLVINSDTVTAPGTFAGTDTLVYTVINATCGQIDSAVRVITVLDTPTMAGISGPSNVCVSATTSLTDATTGGVWSITNTNATISTGGVVSGASAGLDTIVYRITNYCGSWSDTKAIIVNPLANPGTISGADSVCNLASITLSDAISGGTWGSMSTTVATVTGGGVVTGASSGATRIFYTVSNICGPDSAFHNVFVKALAVAGVITGGDSLCVGGAIPTITLTVVNTGGTWTIRNTAIATIAGGVVTGVATGVDTITYTVTNSCNSANATFEVTVNSIPAPTVSGVGHVCIGSHPDTLYATPLGGTWASTNTSLATVGLTTGYVVGVAPGSDTIIYSLTNFCGTGAYHFGVTVFASDKCPDGVANVLIGDGIIKVYPNPSEGLFTVELPEVGSDVSIIIVDMYGKVVESQFIKNNTESKLLLDINNVARGTYLIKVMMNDKLYKGNIVIIGQ